MSLTTTMIEAPSILSRTKTSEEMGSRVVRFDGQCVLIPESPKPKRSMVVTRSYSLPLWKRRGRQPDFEVAEESSEPSACSSSPENTRVVLKVPIPTFRRRSSRSPTRGRSVSTSPTMLTPCLVHRDTSSSPEIPSKTPSRPSLPIYHRRHNDITIPLRDCCQACERITEECIRKGDHWQEKFSRGARRRRSVSLDQPNSLSKMQYSSLPIKSSNCTQAYSDDEALEIDAEPRRGISLTVDEIDKRRKYLGFNLGQGLHQNHSSGSSSSYNSHEREVSSSSSSSFAYSDELIPDVLDSRRCLRGSPIKEEDEAELFPLPRRTPSATPSPRASPSPSPNGSSSCLPSSVVGLKLAAARSSKESVASRDSSSQESLLKISLTRKLPGAAGPSFSHRTLQASDKGLPNVTSSRVRPLPPLPHPPDVDLTSLSCAANDNALMSSCPYTICGISSTIPGSTSHSDQPCITSDAEATHITSSSPTLSHNSAPQSLSPERRKRSFTAPFVKAGEAIKGVSADVLKGVNSMSVGSPF